jgi:hypothetical protein
MILIISGIILIIVILFFSSPKLSPIPYYPSNRKDMPLIIKSLNLKNNQVIYDLGAGDGIVIFEAAKEAFKKGLNTVFVAIEINPILILILQIQRFFHPNKRNIEIVWGDMFNMNIKNQILKSKNTYQKSMYLYISPWLIEKTLSIIKKQFSRFNIVSYFYPVKSLKSNEKIVRGVKNIYVYKV